ncbi:methyltransferase [Streptomyces mauvecolor]|uniref:Methyltransferase n=1 Tax=Streptomyces mauvecolor TaxID=58345 RepID=A0ABV9UXI7_9ACTN
MKISDAVLDVLSRAHTDGPRLSLFEQLDRSEYLAVDKVLKAAGGKWNRSAGAHLFPTSAADAVEALLLTGEVCRPQDFGYFPTPAPVVEKLLSLADLRAGDEVLEPSAGRGAIAAEAARTCPVDCIELLADNAQHIANAGYARSVTVADFLTLPAEPRYDRVVMNPPFARQADIDHVTHALSFLRSHGRLTAVMSAALTFRTNAQTANFRALIERSGGSVHALPDGAFKPSGTAVRAVLVTIPAP